MIPNNLTHREVGAFLMAIGEHMVDHGVCADAVLAEDMIFDSDYRLKLGEDINRHEGYGLSRERLDQLLSLTLEDAITFNEADR